MRIRFAFPVVLIVLAGCASTPATQPLPAPWSAPALTATQVPQVYFDEWSKAENREGCALVAPAALGHGEGATLRRANFAGGWAVAYDLPGQRSAFGIAGAGIEAGGATYEWPYRREWADGSSAGYGPEGGTGPNQLAYLQIAGQRCLYNIWSNISREHLEYLLGQLRFVRER